MEAKPMAPTAENAPSEDADTTMKQEGDGDGDPSSQYLDLTSFQLHDLSDVEIPEGLVDLDLTANRLSSIDPRITSLSQLRKLSLRQNLFNDLSLEPLSLSHPLSSLQELILRDNKLTRVPDVSIFRNLSVFDVSFNEIPSLSGLSTASSTIKELYVSKNEVNKVMELEHLHALQILELGSNKLRVMENLENLTNLQELWLGRNRIKAVNLCGLRCIKKISLQSNRLTAMSGFQDCVALEELYLSHNGITKMEGLSTLVNLHVLDVSSNKLTSVDDIQALTKCCNLLELRVFFLSFFLNLKQVINFFRLEDLWLNDNQITSLEGLEVAVAGSRETLTTIYLENNPCAKSSDYTSVLRQKFPNLQQLDSDVF